MMTMQNQGLKSFAVHDGQRKIEAQQNATGPLNSKDRSLPPRSLQSSGDGGVRYQRAQREGGNKTTIVYFTLGIYTVCRFG